ncbi:hypothetical protein I3843_06G070700 [Carya illinoinensis]|nr:hypothetical protein I3843_06G070700 [Carya illinoinensis]
MAEASHSLETKSSFKKNRKLKRLSWAINYDTRGEKGTIYAVFTDKSIQLLGKNQYTSNVELGSTRIEIKHFGHQLPGKGRRMRPIMGLTMHYHSRGNLLYKCHCY